MNWLITYVEWNLSYEIQESHFFNPLLQKYVRGNKISLLMGPLVWKSSVGYSVDINVREEICATGVQIDF